MPHASELEEFGLEVEQENHALITPTRTNTNLPYQQKNSVFVCNRQTYDVNQAE